MQLKNALFNALSATSKFGQFCIPMLIEKLSSANPNAKLDTCDLLQLCFPVYQDFTHIAELWGLLKELIENEDDCMDSALNVLSVISKSTIKTNSNENLIDFL